MEATIARDTRTARQLAAAFRKAQDATYAARTREQMQQAHDAAEAIYREAQRRKGKDAAIFRRIIEGSAR